MKNSIKMLAVAAILGFAGTASAQSNQAQVYVGADMFCPITAAPIGNGLDFGNVINVPGGTVSMDATTGNLTYGGGTNPGGNAGSTSRGEVEFTGAEGFAWSATEPATTVIHDGTALSNITVNLAYTAATGTLSGTLGKFTCDGKSDVYIGGSFTVPNNMPSSTYVGNVNVTVNYQ